MDTATARPVSFVAPGFDFQADQLRRIEGPTRRQALKMAARADALTVKAAALHAGEPGDDFANYDRAFDLDTEAAGIRADLEAYGFSPATGRPA